MVDKLSKSEILEKVQETFSKTPSKEEIRKIRILAMTKNIKLGENKKKFCKKCLTFFNSTNSSIRIKKPYKILKCLNCNNISRYKLK
jgi:RNase P subunit RPR2